MSNVVPFIPRAAGGDWTSGERERLAELAGKLTASGAHVDAAYGVSDAGDPWCVITDEADEVLIHVARIDGQVVIHDAAADAVQEDDSLWSAFERLMGPDWREGRDLATVVPLRQAQSLLALVAAILFVRELLHVDTPAPAQDAPELGHGEAAQADAVAAAAAQDSQNSSLSTQTHNADEAAARRPSASAQAAQTPAEPRAAPIPAQTAQAAAHDAAPTAPTELVQAAPALPRAVTGGAGGETLAGGAGNDLIVGTRGGDHLMGAGGDDTLIGHGAQPGQIDLLEGGAGNDRLTLEARTVAVGGEGQDTFVVARTPEARDPAPQAKTETPNEGVILDYSGDDRIEFAAAGVIVSVTVVSDVLDGLHGFATLNRQPATPGVRVGVDYDGDGKADTFVLVSGSATSTLVVGNVVTGPKTGSGPADPEPEHLIELTGATHAGSAAGDMIFG